jgi:DNA-3-methyladenine glycosylase
MKPFDAIPAERTLSRDFYNRNTEEVALELLGKHLVHRSANNRVRIGRIVEVEGYLVPHDPASHSARLCLCVSGLWHPPLHERGD